MSSSEGKKSLFNRTSGNSTSRVFKQYKTFWLAGLLAFFVPSMAVGAWYAGNTIGANQGADMNGASVFDAADTSGAQASSSAGPGGASASASANGVSSQANSGGGAGSSAQTEVVVNGQRIPVPDDANDVSVSTEI